MSQSSPVTPKTPKIDPALSVPSPSPLVRINDPGFKKLTAAEKLNDRNYRELVYQSYPNESTCACEPEPNLSTSSCKSDKFNMEVSGNFLVCRSGCKSSCCSSVRQQDVASFEQDNANKDDKVPPAPFMPTYCVGSSPGCDEDRRKRKAHHNGGYCDVLQSRLRGGGEGGEGRGEEGMYPQSGEVNRAMVRSFDDAWNGRNGCVVNRRLEGGGGCGYEYMERRQRGNGESCVTKPYPGVDCLIKTFRETQEFVESLGKVPGVAGLGLMDPAESPYFRRERTKVANAETTEPAASSGVTFPNNQCAGPCNPQMMRSVVGGLGCGGGLFPGATPFTIAVPGRGGVVREGVPSMPGPELRYPTEKLRKRDDREKMKDFDAQSLVQPADAETVPCGKSRCKAKRRKNSLPEASPLHEPTEDKKTVAHTNTNDGRISRAVNKVKGGSGHRSSEPRPSGDRTGRSKSAGKSRRRMRFVYSVGDAYSGTTCGHKDCIEDRRRVPWNMGWLWNLNQTVGRLKPRVGWKPGAIARHISEIIHEAKAKRLLNHKSRPQSRSTASARSRSRSPPSRGKRSKPQGDRRSVKKTPTKSEEEEDGPEPPPTLYIHRKDGTYYCTMYPIKQENMDIPKLEEPMKPLQFKIAKNKDDASVATSSTASDMEIEFSPPAAVNRYRKKPNVVHVDTQVKQQDIVAALNNDSGKKDKKKGKKGKK